MQTFRFKCQCHIGDQIFMLWFLNAAAKRWPDINFSFWATAYDEVKPLARALKNLEITRQDEGHAIEGWMAQDGFYHAYRGDGSKFIDFMIRFHAYVCLKNGLPEWTMPDRREMLLPAECMDGEHALKGESFDVLFVNSAAMSGQCANFDQEGLNEMARRVVKSEFKTVVTHPCGLDVPTTTTLGLKLNQLGELASRCKIVVGIANAPFLVTFNELAFPHVKRWVNFSCDRVNFDDDRVIGCYSQPQFETQLGEALKAFHSL